MFLWITKFKESFIHLRGYIFKNITSSKTSSEPPLKLVIFKTYQKRRAMVFSSVYLYNELSREKLNNITYHIQFPTISKTIFSKSATEKSQNLNYLETIIEKNFPY